MVYIYINVDIISLGIIMEKIYMISKVYVIYIYI